MRKLLRQATLAAFTATASVGAVNAGTNGYTSAQLGEINDAFETALTIANDQTPFRTIGLLAVGSEDRSLNRFFEALVDIREGRHRYSSEESKAALAFCVLKNSERALSIVFPDFVENQNTDTDTPQKRALRILYNLSKYHSNNLNDLAFNNSFDHTHCTGTYGMYDIMTTKRLTGPEYNLKRW